MNMMAKREYESKYNSMFTKAVIDTPTYADLRAYAGESVGKGRTMSIHARVCDGMVPIVRSTTPMKAAAVEFSKYDDLICTRAGITANNAMVEHYTGEYRTMGFHSDMSLDLQPGSTISLFSVYDGAPGRKLIVMDKLSNESREIILDNGSVVTFDTDTNARYLHKIVAFGDSPWIGITYRTSHTWVSWIDSVPYINELPFMLATPDEAKKIYSRRSDENRAIAYEYPNISYTLSPGDLLPVACNRPCSH